MHTHICAHEHRYAHLPLLAHSGTSSAVGCTILATPTEGHDQRAEFVSHISFGAHEWPKTHSRSSHNRFDDVLRSKGALTYTSNFKPKATPVSGPQSEPSFSFNPDLLNPKMPIKLTRFSHRRNWLQSLQLANPSTSCLRFKGGTQPAALSQGSQPNKVEK